MRCFALAYYLLLISSSKSLLYLMISYYLSRTSLHCTVLHCHCIFRAYFQGIWIWNNEEINLFSFLDFFQLINITFHQSRGAKYFKIFLLLAYAAAVANCFDVLLRTGFVIELMNVLFSDEKYKFHEEKRNKNHGEMKPMWYW